ncbi:MAG: polysaccharide deacetylase family protein [Clostridia bacterium]|nr:polysaccharide deacetylase family protein [Clostridia bacterium]
MKLATKYGSHSDTHPHVNNLSYEKNVDQIINSNKKIEKIINNKTNLYRTPYGEYNDTVIQAANDNKFYTIQWNLDTLDYSGITGDEMWNRLKDKLKSGDIILSHNGTKHTADALEMLINKIKQKGYSIVKVSDLIYKDNYTINSDGTQIQNK